MLTNDARVDAADDFVQHVDAEHEVVEVTNRSDDGLGDQIEWHHVVGDGAAEENFILSVDARIGGETPQQNENVGDEQEELGGFTEHAALFVDVVADRVADAVVETRSTVARQVVLFRRFADFEREIVVGRCAFVAW